MSDQREQREGEFAERAEAVKTIVAERLGVAPLAVTPMPFGHNSITYEVTLPERSVMVRTHADTQVFAGTEHNLKVLSGLGLPVPRVLTVDFTLSRVPFAYMILEKIPGRDLRYELAAMSRPQMTRLAEQMVAFQRAVNGLPRGAGYGYVAIGAAGPHASWWDLIRPWAASEISETDVDLGRLESRVRLAMAGQEPFFRRIEPVCFLDDITVKNVIVHQGELQGLVDFDCVCYGDPLYWMALTAVGIVSDVGIEELFYSEEIQRLWGMSARQAQILALYTAGMALDFLRNFAAQETPEWRQRMLAAATRWAEQVT